MTMPGAPEDPRDALRARLDQTLQGQSTSFLDRYERGEVVDALLPIVLDFAAALDPQE